MSLNVPVRIIGVDPGLNKTGWGIIEADGNRLSFIACGTIKKKAGNALPESLAHIDASIEEILNTWSPDESAIEVTFVNCNPASALVLGQARGAAIASLARKSLPVAEYGANLVKKSVVGNGHADKNQVTMMVSTLLPAASKNMKGADEADALAIAICHAHHRQTVKKIAGAV